jgi:putative sterol carrier protein
MSGWRRQLLLRQIFRVMPRRVDRAEAAGLDAVVEFRVTGRRDGGVDIWQLQIEAGRPRSVRDGDAEPTLVVETDGVTFLRLVTGAANAPAQILRGRIKLGGDVLFATELPRYFRTPG